MGLLTNNKLLTETENIAPKPRAQRTAKQEASAKEARESRENKGGDKNDKKYRARFAPVKKREQKEPREQKSAPERRRQENRGQGENRPVQRSAAKKPREIRSAPVRFISLGGLNEIGKNLYVYECCNDMFIVDCGLAFPDEDMPGVDLVIPDFTYVEQNAGKIRGVVITHGHEDHIGAVPYFLKKFPGIPVYATPLTIGIIEGKLAEHGIRNAKLCRVHAGDTVRAGVLEV